MGFFDRLRGKKDPELEAKNQAAKEEKARKEAEEEARKEAEKLAKKQEEARKKELKKQAKEDKKAQKEEFDAIDAKVDEIRHKAKAVEKEGDFPHSKIYKLVNLGIKIALKGKDEGGKVKGFKVFKSIVGNAGTIISAGKLGLEIKEELEAELGIKLKDVVKNPDDVNKVLQSDFVKGIMSDFWLWEVVRLQTPRINGIIPRFKKEITEGLASLIFEPSALNDKTKMDLVEVILDQENTLSAFTDILAATKGEIAKMLADEETKLSKGLKELGVDTKDVARFIPHSEPLLKIASEKQKDLAKVFKVLKPVLLNEKGLEAADLIKVGAEIKSLADTFLPEVGKILAERKAEVNNLLKAKPVQNALKVQNIKVEDVQLILDSALPAIGKILSSDLVSGLTQSAQDFVGANSAIIKKMRQASEDAEKGVFKPENDLNSEEIKSLANGAFDLLVAAKPEKFLSEEVITPELVKGLVGVIPKIVLDKAGISKDLVKKAVPHLRDIAALMMNSSSIEGYKKAVMENLDTLLDSAKSNKEKTKAGFAIIDAFFEKVSSKDMAELFGKKGGIKDFLKENKAELGAAIDKAMKGDREISKLKISGERVINAMLDEKTLNEMGKIYQDLKKNAVFGVVGKSIKLMYNNRDFRVLVFDIIISSIIAFVRDNLYPNYFKRAMVGASVHNVAELVCKKAEIAKDKVNLKEAAMEHVEGLNTLGLYTVTYGAFSALRLDNLDFKNMVIDDCDFRRTTFGSNDKPLVMSSCSFSACDFTSAKFKGTSIDLSSSTFDLESFITMLPQLEKAHKAGIKIDIEGVKLYLPALPTKANQEKIESIKKSEFGKIVYEQCVAKAQAKDQSRGG